MAGNISFRDAAAKFSDDEYSKLVGGDMTNPQTGSSFCHRRDGPGTVLRH